MNKQEPEVRHGPTVTIAELRLKFPKAPESFFLLQANAGGAFDPALRPRIEQPPTVAPFPPIPPNSVRPDDIIDTCESASQQAVVRWWGNSFALRYGLLNEKLLMAFPLQGKRTKKAGSRMSAEGMRAGTPDMFLAVPRGKFHGLWIENKHDDGRPTKEQREVLDALEAQGYSVAVCYTYAHAVNVIHDYLSQ